MKLIIIVFLFVFINKTFSNETRPYIVHKNGLTIIFGIGPGDTTEEKRLNRRYLNYILDSVIPHKKDLQIIFDFSSRYTVWMGKRGGLCYTYQKITDSAIRFINPIKHDYALYDINYFYKEYNEIIKKYYSKSNNNDILLIRYWENISDTSSKHNQIFNILKFAVDSIDAIKNNQVNYNVRVDHSFFQINSLDTNYIKYIGNTNLVKNLEAYVFKKEKNHLVLYLAFIVLLLVFIYLYLKRKK